MDSSTTCASLCLHHHRIPDTSFRPTEQCRTFFCTSFTLTTEATLQWHCLVLFAHYHSCLELLPQCTIFCLPLYLSILPTTLLLRFPLAWLWSTSCPLLVNEVGWCLSPSSASDSTSVVRALLMSSTGVRSTLHLHAFLEKVSFLFQPFHSLGAPIVVHIFCSLRHLRRWAISGGGSGPSYSGRRSGWTFAGWERTRICCCVSTTSCHFIPVAKHHLLA